uniref:Si:dkey-25g12.4 n=1 Tax=Seriola lalandi dorsalis TaxID=1841481 RepID=A0A3B4WX49_SERLL
MSGRSDLPATKTITVYRNGDAFFPGRKIVVNPRQVSTFESFLTSLTRGIEAPFGAVRRLYTPAQGHKVKRLDDLNHGSVYVAAGNEQFKKLDRIVASARWRRTTDESCTIKVMFFVVVFTNGDVLVPPTRIRIPKYTLRNWENVLAMVTDKVHLRTGAVYRLCTLEGDPVCGSTELEKNQHYVAVGAEKFKALPYDQQTSLFFCCFISLPRPTNGCRNSKEYQQTLPLVFSAQNKRSEMAGAAEVQEDRQVKVDLPIDQVKHNPIQYCSLMRSLWCACDIDLCGPGQIKNNEIQHLCQVEMSAGSEVRLSQWKRAKDGELESDAHLSKLFL